MQTQMINLSIPKPLLKALDQQAKKEVKTRSEALRDAVRQYVISRQKWQQVFDFGQERARKLNLKSNQIENLIDVYRQGK